MQKKSLVLTICIVVVVIALILLVVYLVGGGSTDIGKGGNKTSNNPVVAELSEEVKWSLDPEKSTDGTVTIYIEAGAKDAPNIESISLPNGQLVTSSNTQFEVSKNGDYTFTFNTKSGGHIEKVVTVENINEISAYNPYIPEGFSHIEGTEVGTGFIIEDKDGNQFVWVPVETGGLVRNTDGNEQYEESDYTATGFYNSVAKYYGFYIARYESSQGNKNGLAIAKSVEGEIPWSNINYEDSYNAAKNTATAYDYIGVKTALINSFAWDSTLAWINKTVVNYSSNTSYGNYSGTILECGGTSNDEVNSICDLAGNLKEWTTEIYHPNLPEPEENENTVSTKKENTETEEEPVIQYGYRVVRGGSAVINKVANSHIGEAENLSDPYWGFRMILYRD